jgi:hypothetical protein
VGEKHRKWCLFTLKIARDHRKFIHFG